MKFDYVELLFEVKLRHFSIFDSDYKDFQMINLFKK
jgi:hypothetical protein